MTPQDSEPKPGEASNQDAPSVPSISLSDSGPKIDNVMPPPSDVSPPQPSTPSTPPSGGFAGGQVSSQTPYNKPKGLLKKLVLPLIILIVLLGGSAAAYFGYVVPHEPKNIIKSALVSMINGNLKSSNFNGTVAVTEKGASQPINVTLSGVEDQSGELDLNITVDAIVTTFGLELRSVDGQSAYFRLTGLDSVVQFLHSIGGSAGSSASSADEQAIIGLLKAVNNQWYQINGSLLTSVEKSLKISPTSANTQDNSKALEKLYSQNVFLTIKKTLPDQTIAGQPSYHAQVAVDSAKLSAFLAGVNSQHLSGSTISQQALGSVLRSLSTSKTASTPFDIWVTKSGHFIDQISVTSTDSGSTANVTLTLSKINQPISVQTPAGAKSVLDLLTQLTQLSGGSSSSLSPLDLLNLGGGSSSITQSL